MKIFNNKNIIGILFILTLVILSIVSYFSFNYYVDNQKAKENRIVFQNLSSKIKAIDLIQSEVQNGALYFSQKKEDSLEAYLKAQKNTDTASLTNSIKSELKHARTKLSTLNENFIEVFINNYKKQIITPLIQDLSKIKFENLSFNKEISFIQKHLLLEENLMIENIGVLYVVSLQEKFSKEEFVVWNNIVFNDVLPDYNNLNKALSQKISEIINKDKYLTLQNRNRVIVFEGSLTGNYSLSIKDWKSAYEEKINSLISLNSTILDFIDFSIEKDINIKNDRFVKYLVISILLFTLLIILGTIIYNIRKDSQLFEDTLREIERLLNKEQQAELKQLIEERDINKIYNFLISTIKEANETKDLFLANMSHEIRTPLNGIIGFTKLLKGANLTSEEKEYVSIIEYSSENLLNIVNSILDLSKIKANKIELESIEFNPLVEFEKIIETYVAKAEEKNIDLNVYIDPYLPTEIIGDSTKISQILVNLISNAIKFTPEHGKVNVSIKVIKDKDNSSFIEFSVSDTGIGISEEQKNKIFEEFTQADISTSRKFGGTGLGLSISKKLIELMGGKLEVDSVVNKGTKFSFSLFFLKTTDSEVVKYPKVKEKISFVGKNNPELFNILKDYVKVFDTNIIFNDLHADIVFIDFNPDTFLGDIEKISKNSKKVLFVYKNQKSSISNYFDYVDKVIYKPITFSKIKNILVQSEFDKVFEQEKKKREEAVYLFKNLNVLLAEDNIINQKLMVNLLNRFGIYPDIANNGEEALNKRKEKYYDLIFMDIQMPVMNGIEATKAILKYEKDNNQRHSMIVALTANALQGDRDKYLKEGMDEYLSKPIDNIALNNLLLNYFEKQSYIEETTTKVEETTIKEVKQETNITKENKEVLIFHSVSLTGRLLKSILNNNGIQEIDIISNPESLLTLIEKNTYKYVIFEATPFVNVSCLISDLIKDSGSKPLAIQYGDIKNEKFCAEMIDESVTEKDLLGKLGLI